MSSTVIRKGVLSVDPTMDCIDEAVAAKANLIISHHALVHASFFKIRELAFEKTRLLTANNIWVYVTGDPWNHSSQGITESLCQALRLEPEDAFTVTNFKGDEVPVGRVCAGGARQFNSILDRAKKVLGRSAIAYRGELDRVHDSILVIGGRVDSVQPVIKMLQEGIDVVITGEMPSEIETILSDLHIAFIELSHHATDILGMSKLRGLLSLKHPNVTFTLHDENPVQPA